MLPLLRVPFKDGATGVGHGVGDGGGVLVGDGVSVLTTGV
jgi:hypothetical protein